jgi:hypothetical protein
MKTLHTRSPTFLAGGLALALFAANAFAAAASPPADPDPTSKGTPMEDTHVPNTQSTRPYSSSSSSSSTSSTSSDMSAKTIGMQSKFDSLDVNHDGYIDKQEAAADTKLSNQFAKLDANKDSKLSITELSNAKGLAMNKKTKDSSTKDQYQQ